MTSRNDDVVVVAKSLYTSENEKTRKTNREERSRDVYLVEITREDRQEKCEIEKKVIQTSEIIRESSLPRHCVTRAQCILRN